MDNELRLIMAAVVLQKQDFTIRCMAEAMRPFADAANAQQHTDCGGCIKQSDWEAVAEMMAAFDQDRAREAAQDALHKAQATHAH